MLDWIKAIDPSPEVLDWIKKHKKSRYYIFYKCLGHKCSRKYNTVEIHL